MMDWKECGQISDTPVEYTDIGITLIWIQIQAVSFSNNMAKHGQDMAM